MTIDHPTQSNVKGKSKESQRKVKGKGNECLLAFYLQDKGKMLVSYYTRTLYGILKKTNEGLS